MYNTRRITQPVKVEALDLQELGAELRIYGEIDDPVYRHFNPSLVWYKDKLKISIRSCNFAVVPKGKWYFRDGRAHSITDVLIGDLDPETLRVSNLQKYDVSADSPKEVLLAGVEDVRLYVRKNKLHASGFISDRLTRSLHNASAGMAEFEVKGKELKYIRSVPKPVKEIIEKNWCPPDKPSKLFDYTYSDSQIYKDGSLIGKPTRTQIHGGSILLKQKDATYLSLVHEKIADPTIQRVGGYSRANRHNRVNIYDKYIYYTYLARHDKQGIITHLTKPFRFGTLENIEFAAGLAEYDDYFILTTGIRDCKYGIVKIEKDKLVDLLEPVDKAG